jgi:hypothetical protein
MNDKEKPSAWKLVPVEPTEEMIDAARDIARGWSDGFPRHEEGYAAMLAAAPTPAPSDAAVGDACHVDKWSSRCCERGTKSCVVEHAAVSDERESVDEVLEIVSSYGPYGRDINDALRFQIVLADEVRCLRALYLSAVRGRADFRDALRESRAALAQTAPVGEATLSAFEFLKAALHADGDYAWSWHCNLAMPIMDSIHCAPELANKAGADLMQYLFGIDVRKFDQWHHDEQSEVIGPDWQVSNVLDDIARQCATKTDEKHEYLPAGPATQRGFHAHKWVIESMEAAIQWDRRMNRVATPPASREALTPIPGVHGVSRYYDNPCALLLMLKREPTDDELRAIHALLATAAQREGEGS